MSFHRRLIGADAAAFALLASEAAASSSPGDAQDLLTLIRSSAGDEVLQQRAAELLGRMPLAEPTGWLCDLSCDPQPALRQAAAIGLAFRADPVSLLALIELLADGANGVRNLAERSLMARLPDVRRFGVEPLLALLRHAASLTRSPAARLLGLAQAEQALAPLLEMLRDDPQWLARMWAAKALGDLGQPLAAERLAESLQHDERNRVRAAAAEAVAKLRPARAEEWLRNAFKDDSDGGVRRKAAEGLSALGLPGFEDAAQDDDGSI